MIILSRNSNPPTLDVIEEVKIFKWAEQLAYILLDKLPKVLSNLVLRRCHELVSKLN